MPFLAVVYVRDAATANRLARNWSADGYDDQNFKIVGMYRMPNKDQVPTCTGSCAATDRKLNGWSRHPQYGHTVHGCGRRHRDWRKRIRGALLDTLGINLLKREITPATFQNPEGWGK